MEQARAEVEDAAEAVGHLRWLATGVAQRSYVPKDAVRDRRNWISRAMFQHSLLACGHKALESMRALTPWARVMSATSELGEARLAATRWRRGGNVLPAYQRACKWATQLLDTSFMM